MPRGLFLSLDGLDGTGKSTQCRLLADWLRVQGRMVTSCSDPGGTATGDSVRKILLDPHRPMSAACEALLFMASRAQLVDEVIRPALRNGHVVISDRFLLATIVYQGHAGGLDADLLGKIGRLATGGLEPDLTLVLDAPVEVALARQKSQADRFEIREHDFQQRVRAGFLAEAGRNPGIVRVVDACPPQPLVQEAIRREVARVLEASSRS